MPSRALTRSSRASHQSLLLNNSGASLCGSWQDRARLATLWHRRHASSTPKTRPRTAIFFPGQGVQRVGMLAPWLEAFPRTAPAIVDEIDTTLGFSLSTIIRDGPSKTLTATPNAQPAIMATSILILRILESEFGFLPGARADVVLGHSLGEFAALVAGGYLSFADSLSLVRRRAEAMAAATAAAHARTGAEYGMVALLTEPAYLSALVDAVHEFVGQHRLSSGATADSGAATGGEIADVLVANVNSKNQIVVSGDVARIRTLVAHVRQFLGHDPRAVRLRADSPFHSPVMQPAVQVMRRLLDGPRRDGAEGDVVSWPGSLPCVSNVSARPFGSRAELKDLLSRQCVETVRWWDSIRYLDQEERVRRWVGIGPGKVGRNLVGKEVGMRGRDRVKGGGVWAITDPSEIEEVLRGLEETESVEDEE